MDLENVKYTDFDTCWTKKNFGLNAIFDIYLSGLIPSSSS